jgi:eukaryotic-like serine/threonine-protein kinase
MPLFLLSASVIAEATPRRASAPTNSRTPYVRGLVYLHVRETDAAAAEFEKIIKHRGLTLNSDLGPLSGLGLARAREMKGDILGARTAYQNFLTLWKDADPDIPILKQAKAEYAKLR